jgi:hypothetical protein
MLILVSVFFNVWDLEVISQHLTIRADLYPRYALHAEEVFKRDGPFILGK